MQGAVCPACGKQLMTFNEFYRNKTPDKKKTCRHCGTRVRRSYRIILLFLAALVCGGGVMYLSDSLSWSRGVEIPVVFMVLFGITVGLSYISWKYIPWVTKQ